MATANRRRVIRRHRSASTFITGFIEPGELPDLYGDGAFPIDYPNPWDQRQGRTGYGIWLHGTPSNTYSRPPRDSDGCVILSNQDLNRLDPYLDIGTTPVVLADGIEWLAPAQLKQRRQQFSALLEQWQADWESRDAQAYLRRYSRDYKGLGMDYTTWVSHKRRVNPSKRYINVALSDTSMYLYPGKTDLLVVTFTQDYESDNFQRTFRKRQFWRKEADGRWRVIYEGNISS
ncbi:MAG: L,D-transpeptidase family protein [Gammaproteobacteria bacterium]|nr:L,D-transpeptidase family protein [Gammaproteobacteria bacterium]